MTSSMLRNGFRKYSMLMAGIALLASGCVKVEDNSSGTSAEAQALLDRAAVEDFIIDYYANFGGVDEDFSIYYTADGVLDVNGMVAEGTEAIAAMYAQLSGAGTEQPRRDPKAPPASRTHMQVTNLKVEVSGDTATASMLWSGMTADSVVGQPRVTEFGRDHTDLVRQDGKWLIKRRVITSDSGMPESMLNSYIVR